jgi:CRP-like cAMP-binding protein
VKEEVVSGVTMFGMRECLFGGRRSQTVTTITKCNFIILPSAAVDRITEMYDEIGTSLKEAYEEHARAMKLESMREAAVFSRRRSLSIPASTSRRSSESDVSKNAKKQKGTPPSFGFADASRRQAQRVACARRRNLEEGDEEGGGVQAQRPHRPHGSTPPPERDEGVVRPQARRIASAPRLRRDPPVDGIEAARRVAGAAG